MPGMTPRPYVVGFFREKLDTEVFTFKAPQYQQAYHEVLDRLNEKGTYVAILMGQGTYVGNGKFTKHWIQTNDNGRYEFERRDSITVDALYVKDYFDAQDDMLQVNTPVLRKLCSNKHATYELMSDFQPKSTIVDSEAKFRAAVDSMPGDMLVVKTLAGNSGTGVFVGKKASFDSSEYDFPFPWQVQEYIETVGGIPGITPGRHDIRVVMNNGEAIISTLRTPPEGGLKSNIGFGGETRLIAVGHIPAELLDLCAQIDTRLAPLGALRHYSADFGLTPQGWRLFELNAMPGTINRARGEEAIYYQDKLADFLRTAAKVGRRNHERKRS